MAHRLAGSRSPHLLQHAADPVDWYPWGEEAFAAARERDVPVLLSVGYSACHGCHVMARESFQDPGVAAVLDAGFVAVKVDREERPDVDAAATAALTALTGRGGWPVTLFLTADGEPFHAGTYYPPAPVEGVPSFHQVLAAVATTWRERRPEVQATAGRIAAALAARRSPVAGIAGADDLEVAVAVLAAEEDVEHGGFGGAPKFPPAMVCELLLRHAAAPPSSPASAAVALGLAERALAAVAASGMVDQVVGGSARCTVDDAWAVPRFEKMLYDNALLARTWLHWWRLTGAPAGRRCALEACDWLLAALLTPEGGFASSLDADAGGVEGGASTWTPAQLAEALDEGDAAWAGALLGVTADAASSPRLLRDPWQRAEDAERWAAVRARLRAARAARPQPARDDKVVTAWNGLAVAALAEVGAQCGRPDLVEAARRCADLLLRVHHDAHGRLLRLSRDGVAGTSPASLQDHGCLAEGLLALHAVTGEVRWLRAAGEVVEALLVRFTAGPPGGVGRQAGGPALYDTPHDDGDPRLLRLGRPAGPVDAETPSGTSAAAGALLSWAALTGSGRHRAAAEAALAATGALARSAPRLAGWGLAVAQAALVGPVAVAVVGEAGDPAADALHAAALAGTSPGLVVARGVPGSTEPALLSGRGPVAGGAAAHVRRDGAWSAAERDPDGLRLAVGGAVDAAASPEGDPEPDPAGAPARRARPAPS